VTSLHHAGCRGDFNIGQCLICRSERDESRSASGPFSLREKVRMRSIGKLRNPPIALTNLSRRERDRKALDAEHDRQARGALWRFPSRRVE